MAIPSTHPLVKTATDLRRSINRLSVFKETNPQDDSVIDGSIDKLVHEMQEARSHIPREYRDADLKD